MNTNILVSKNAWKKMTEIIKQSNNKYGFLYSASSGGCNGFNFVLELLDKKIYDTISKNKYLTILTHKNIKLYVEPYSEMHLLGTSINYITEDYTIGQFENKFVFDVNKDLMTTCGCGTSFTPKI
jgi:iron-sulfur cluster assembly accessory protein